MATASRCTTRSCARYHRRRREIEEALEHAIEQGELALHYQAVVRTDGSVAGFEALLRWSRPDGSMIPPGEFIPIAEETGLIVPIGDWIIHEACSQLEAWSYDGIDAHWISINVSALQLRHDNLRHSLENAIARMGADPRRLMIELTESAMVSPGVTNIAQLQQLRDLGVRVAVDDFGTGYSSLAYLRQLPVDVIKIDQTFVAELLEDTAATSVVLAIVQLAHALDLEVIAEGAESGKQVECLTALECDYIQGFFFAAAVPADVATAIIRRGLGPPESGARPGVDAPRAADFGVQKPDGSSRRTFTNASYQSGSASARCSSTRSTSESGGPSCVSLSSSGRCHTSSADPAANASTASHDVDSPALNRPHCGHRNQ